MPRRGQILRFLTPGVYELKVPILVLHHDTIVLGLGFATLVPQTAKDAIAVADVDGVEIARLIGSFPDARVGDRDCGSG